MNNILWVLGYLLVAVCYIPQIIQTIVTKSV